MSMLEPLVSTDPAAPRLTVYDEAAGTRMEFSGVTLDNWAAKVANMLDEEFELEDGACLLIDVPPSWQAAVIALGAYNTGRVPVFAAAADAAAAGEAKAPAVVFTTAERAAEWAAQASQSEVVAVSDDPFGRGVVEAGGELPVGVVDFGPTVRFYGDEYWGGGTSLRNFALEGYEAQRYWVPGWSSAAEFEEFVLAPLAAGGSVVLATGLMSTERMEHLIEAEKVTRVLTQG